MFGNIFKKEQDQDNAVPAVSPLGTTQSVPAIQPQNMPTDDPVSSLTPTQTSPFAGTTTPSVFSSTPQSPVAANLSGVQSENIGNTETANPLPLPGVPDSDTSQSDPLSSTQNKSAMDSLSHVDSRSAQVLTRAREEAHRIKQQTIEPEQLLLGLLYDQQAYNMLSEMGTDGGILSKEIQTDEKMGTYEGQPELSKISQEIFEQAYRDAKMRGANFVTPEDILIVLFSTNYRTASYLQKHKLKKETVVEKFSQSPTVSYGKRMLLEKYGIDLTEEARAGRLDPIAGRDKEIDRIIHILLRRTKNNPIIIGETGVGKTAIVEGLAQKIVQGAVPKELQDKRIFQLDVASLVAGASHRGEFEERLRGVINEVLSSNNNIILFIDEIHALMGTGEDGGMNAANIIKPHLARGHFQLIGATTTIEYRKNFEKDKAFERRFQPVTAEEPSEENAFEMLKVIRPKYEKFHNISLPDDALRECVKLSKKYIGERYLPDKAVDLLDEAASEVKLQLDAGNRLKNDPTVKKEDIEKVVSAWTGIPITKLTEDESEKLLKLEDRIHQRLIDQEEAVVAVSEAVRRGRIGLAATNRPIASFVFLGPTGVGKTELAKTLAELLFGRDDAMARLDMSEYMEKHEVAKLIGAPPGYVGYEEGGQLTEAVRKKPYSIVLLDEIEKAHPDVFNILLQLLEDGRLTDNKGNTISFKNTIVICTSNIGSSAIQQHLSTQDPKIKKSPEEFEKNFKELQGIVRDELTKFFRPELLNRFDEVVIFKPLQPEHMAGITRLGIAKTAKLLKEQGFNLQITERAIGQLAKDGYDPVYGARPLRRLIQTAIENPIALALISKKFISGDTIVIDFSDSTNEFFFTKSGGIADIAPMTDEQFRTFIVELNHPDTVSQANDRQQFMEVHDLIVKERVKNNKTANEILETNIATPLTHIQTIREELHAAKSKGDAMATAMLNLAATVAHQIQAAMLLNHIVQQIIHPDEIIQPAKKLHFMELHDKVTQESQRKNPLALKLMSVNDTTPANAIDELMETLRTGTANDNDLATEILLTVNKEIAQEADMARQAEPVTQFKKELQMILNPLYLADPEDKAAFAQLYEKIKQADKSGNTLASSMLSLTEMTSDADIKQLKEQLEKTANQGDALAKDVLKNINDAIEREPLRKLKKTLLLLVNPASSSTPQEKEQYTELQTKINTAGQKGNQIASAVLSVKEDTTDESIKQLLDQLLKAKEQHDEVAEIVMTLLGMIPVAVVSAQQVSNSSTQTEQADTDTQSPQVSTTTPAASAADSASDTGQSAGVTAQTPIAQRPVTFQTPTGEIVPPTPPSATAPLPQPQNDSGILTQPQSVDSVSPASISTAIDSSPVNTTAAADDSLMQSANAYNYSGIPASSRPMGYVAPQSRQEEVE